MGTCKDCKHFKAMPTKMDRGSCDMTGNYNFVRFYEKYGFQAVEPKKAYAYSPDANGLSSEVIVGSDFGCIHFSQAENR